jgi:hypothetical protein
MALSHIEKISGLNPQLSAAVFILLSLFLRIKVGL